MLDSIETDNPWRSSDSCLDLCNTKKELSGRALIKITENHATTETVKKVSVYEYLNTYEDYLWKYDE